MHCAPMLPDLRKLACRRKVRHVPHSKAARVSEGLSYSSTMAFKTGESMQQSIQPHELECAAARLFEVHNKPAARLSGKSRPAGTNAHYARGVSSEALTKRPSQETPR